MEEIVNLIATNGYGVVLMAYFLFKDYKFNQQILDVLGKMENVLAKLETWHSMQEGESHE